MTTPDQTPIDRRGAMGVIGGAIGAAGAAAAFASSAAAQPGTSPVRQQPAARTPDLGGGILTAEELGWDEASGRYTLPDLPYKHDALEPAIDEQTMRIHHGRHHAGYVRGLNAAIDTMKRDAANLSPAAARALMDDITFNGSGVFNHALFWITMMPADDPSAGDDPRGELAEQISKDFGSYRGFKNLFTAAAKGVRGSGWAFLAYEPTAERLIVTTLHNQEDGSMHSARPILGIDVWEHAYYLKYQNNRSSYVDNFFSIINWPKVGELLERIR